MATRPPATPASTFADDQPSLREIDKQITVLESAMPEKLKERLTALETKMKGIAWSVGIAVPLIVAVLIAVLVSSGGG